MQIHIDDQQFYYNDYWSDHDYSLNGHEIVRLAKILQGIVCVMKETTGKNQLKICDLGCGRGWLSNELSKFGSVVGVDLSETGIASAKKRWPSIDFRVADITQWRPDENFDIVVSSEVIEHIPDQPGFANTIRYLIREGGYLILTTPNGKVKKAWDKGGHGAQLIEQWLSPKELRSLFFDVIPIMHYTFMYDFAYHGIFRITSAPKFLKLINVLKLMPFYNAARNVMNMGLYQIMVGQFLRHAKSQ